VYVFVQVERLLRSIYMPQNVYCLHVDAKSAAHVHQTAAAIANCFDNVFVASRLESVRIYIQFGVEFGGVVSETRERTDRQTDRHTYHNSSQPSPGAK